MKKLLERLKEFNTPLYYGIACLVFGVAFTVLPYLWKPALDILLVIAGIFSIFVGILTVSLLDTEYRGIGYYLSVGRTLCLIGFGIFLITSRSSLAWMLCIGYGIYLLVRAIPALIKCVLLPSTAEAVWWVRLLVSIFEILIGLWLIIYPKWPSEYVLAGTALILTGVEILLKRKKREGDSSAPRMTFGTVFDPEFEDKSDK